MADAGHKMKKVWS